MNINKVSKVEYPIGRLLDSFANCKVSTSKSDNITPNESEAKNSSNTHLNEVESRSLKNQKKVENSQVNSSNTTRKKNASYGGLPCSSSGSKSNADKGKKTVKEKDHDVAGQSDKPQNNPTQSRKGQPISAIKSHAQKTATPKDPPICKPKSKVEKNQIPPNKSKKVVSTDPPVTKKKETCKKDPKASVKRPIRKPNNPEPSRKSETQKVVKKINKKNPNSLNLYGPQSDIPIHHIRWEGHDNELSGHKCSLCNKDLSCSPHDADYESHEDEDDRYSDEYKYQIRPTPQILLLAVEILSCGHAFHSECAGYVIPDKESTDPQCVLCLSMG